MGGGKLTRWGSSSGNGLDSGGVDGDGAVVDAGHAGRDGLDRHNANWGGGYGINTGGGWVRGRDSWGGRNWDARDGDGDGWGRGNWDRGNWGRGNWDGSDWDRCNWDRCDWGGGCWDGRRDGGDGGG